MQQFVTIFILNLLTSVDNAIVVGSIARRSKHLVALGASSAVILTVLRTALITGVVSVVNQPGWRLGLGLVVFAVSVRMAHIQTDTRKPEPRFWNLLAVIIVTDLALSIDNILSLAVVSTTVWLIAVGVFLSLLPLLMLLPVISRIIDQIAWLQVLAAGFVAELAADTVLDDKWLLRRAVSGQMEFLIRSACAMAVLAYGAWRLRLSRKVAS